MAGGERRKRQHGGGSQGAAGKQNTPGPGISSYVRQTSCWDFLLFLSTFVPESSVCCRDSGQGENLRVLSVENLMGGRRCSHTGHSPSIPGGPLLASGAVAPSFPSQGLRPVGGHTGVQGSALGWEGGDPPSSRQRPAACSCSPQQTGSTA